MRRYGAWVAVLLLACYLVFAGGAWRGIYDVPLRFSSMVLASIVLATWLIAASRRPELRPRSVLLPAIVVALGSLAISTATSRFPRQSMEYLGYAIVLAALYLLLVRLLAMPFFRVRIGSLAVALTAALGVTYAIANVAHWVEWWQIIGRLSLPPLRPQSESLVYGNPSAVLTLILLFACSALAVVGVHSGTRRLISALALALATFATLVSGSRSGWVAIAMTTIVILALLASEAERRRALRDRLVAFTSNATGVAGLAILGIGGLGAIAVVAPAILRRLTDSGADLRLNYLLAAGRMFTESPIVGTGPGSWVIQRIRYTIAPEADYYIPHAHNIYAQTAAELGLVGLLAGVVLVVSLALLVREAIRDDDQIRRRWGWATAFALLYFGAHQLLDFYVNMPAVLFAAAIPVAWLDATTSKPLVVAGRPLPQHLGRIPGLAGAMLVGVACAGLLWSELPAATASRAVDLANVGSWVSADDAARRAADGDPAVPPYRFTMGLTAANVGDHQRAADAFRSVALSDDLPEAWLDLAAEETLLGNADAAREALLRARRLGLQRPAVAMAIAELAERLGDMALSQSAYVVALTAVPSLAADPWWQADPVRAARFPALVDAAIEATGDLDQWQLALMAGDPERARDLVSIASYGPDALNPVTLIDAWAGESAAMDRVLAFCETHPLDTTALAWAARLEARRGDAERANAYRRWAYAATSVATAAGAELRVSDHPVVGRTLAGDLAEFWGTYTYRRPTPWNLLVPSLIQLELR